MTIPAGWLSSASLASAALRGGKSPSAWQQLTSQSAWNVDGVRRGGQWLAFLGSALPRLHLGPWFGHSLELLAAGSSDAQAKSEAIGRGGRSRTRRPEMAPATRVPRRPVSRAASLPARTTIECLGLPRRATRTGLEDLAGRRPGRRVHGAELGADTSQSGHNGFCLPVRIEPADRATPALAHHLARRLTQTIERVKPLRSDASDHTSVLIDQWSVPLGSGGEIELFGGSTVFNVAPEPSQRFSHEERGERGTIETSATPSHPRPDLRASAVADQANRVDERPPEELTFSPSLRSAVLAAVMPVAMPAALKAETVERQRVLHQEAREPFDCSLESLSTAMKQVLVEEARRQGIDV